MVYTWNFHPELVESARQQGVHGYLSKTLPARELVAAIEAVHAGEMVVSDPPGRARIAVGLDWPGRGEGLTNRESEILALITQGKSNTEVARSDLPQPEHGQVLHPFGLPQDRRRESHPGRAVGGRARLPPRPPPHRPLARRTLIESHAPPARSLCSTSGRCGAEAVEQVHGNPAGVGADAALRR